MTADFSNFVDKNDEKQNMKDEMNPAKGGVISLGIFQFSSLKKRHFLFISEVEGQ